MNHRKPTAAMRRRHNLIAAWRGVADGPLMDLPTLSVAIWPRKSSRSAAWRIV
jgi:hypothetical protein